MAQQSAEWNPGKAKVVVQENMVAPADPRLIRTVFDNLLSNAQKFSPDGGLIEIGKTDEVFWIRDQGVGFDMKYATKVFMPFQRLVHDHEFPGTGIGLANVERIIRRHGGRILVESKPGEGTTFYFTLGPEPIPSNVSP